MQLVYHFLGSRNLEPRRHEISLPHYIGACFLLPSNRRGDCHQLQGCAATHTFARHRTEVRHWRILLLFQLPVQLTVTKQGEVLAGEFYWTSGLA